MKKIIALILVGLALFGLSACGSNSDSDKSDAEPDSSDPTDPEPTKADPTDAPTETPTDAPTDEPIDGPISGGYTEAASPVVTDKIRALVEKATMELDGATYTPVAYVASQVVAGTNHLVLCTITPVAPGAVSRYALITIYDDLNGNDEITNVAKSTVTAPEPYDPEDPVSGGYGTPSDPTVTAEALSAVIKANDALGTMTYEPKALLKQQVVAGMNYVLLCRGKALNGDDLDYAIVTVYADLDGGAEFTEIVGFHE